MRRLSILVLSVVFSIAILGTCKSAFADLYGASGSIVAWGDNSFGQLNVPLGNDFVAVAVRRPCEHTLRPLAYVKVRFPVTNSQDGKYSILGLNEITSSVTVMSIQSAQQLRTHQERRSCLCAETHNLQVDRFVRFMFLYRVLLTILFFRKLNENIQH